MRMMLRFTLPVEKSNAAINDGSLGRTMESILSKLKPEAAYLEGKRGGMIFFDPRSQAGDELHSDRRGCHGRPCGRRTGRKPGAAGR